MEAEAPKLLYIDDDEGFARLLSRSLSKLGFVVEWVGNGAEGLGRLSEQDFDVIALDHFMPGLSGEETLAGIIALPDPPPVVYVTASDETQVAVAALKAGAADYVTKDTGRGFFDLLAAILMQAIERTKLKRAEQAAQAEMEIARERAEILLKEVNHRVANSLTLVVSMAHLHASTLPLGDTRDAMEDFAGKVYAIAQVHKRLYTSQNIRTVVLNDYLTPLMRDLHQGLGGKRSATNIELDCADISVSIDKAISIGVILSELITNVGKYAYPGGAAGEARVFCAMDENNEITIAVEDDGIGIGDNKPRGTGLGSQIVDVLAEGLGGKVVFTKKDRGTRAELRFILDDSRMRTVD